MPGVVYYRVGNHKGLPLRKGSGKTGLSWAIYRAISVTLSIANGDQITFTVQAAQKLPFVLLYAPDLYQLLIVKPKLVYLPAIQSLLALLQTHPHLFQVE